jgi:hypothetical protein
LFQQFLNLLTSQPDMSGPILGTLSNIRLSGGTKALLSPLIGTEKGRRFINERIFSTSKLKKKVKFKNGVKSIETSLSKKIKTNFLSSTF